MMNPAHSSKISSSFEPEIVHETDNKPSRSNKQIKDINVESLNTTRDDTENNGADSNESVKRRSDKEVSSMNSNDYKNAGNRLCSLSRYAEAINYYVKAIEKNPDIAIYYSNKALCHIRLQEWSLAIQDCRTALELDPDLVKAHYFLGQALAELEDYDESLKHLQKSNELAREKKLNFGDDITCQIRSVKRRRWGKLESEESRLENDLQAYLVDLIRKDKERLQREPTTSGDNASRFDAFETKSDIYIDKLENIFNNLRIRRKKRDVPDYLCGKISFELLRDPVITPCGITYDRQDIEEHLSKVGHFDPITRQPLDLDQLVPNLAMKEVVDAYLSENEWAHYY